MQTRFYTLADCRGNLSMLIHDISNYTEPASYYLYGFKLCTRCIGCISNKLLLPSFTNSVIKIQNNDIESIVSFEQLACICLLIIDNNANENDSSASSE